MDNFDIALTIGSTTKYLDLAKSSEGKMWSVSEVYSGLPETDKLFEQTDWKGGFGQSFLTDKARYMDGQNIDTTKEGEFFLGPKFTLTPILLQNEYAQAADGAVFTNESTAAHNDTDNDMTLLPATPAVNDAYYFSVNTTNPSGIYVYISTAGAGTWTITWEYYNGSWTALSNVSDGTSGFKSGTGIKAVTFTTASDITSTSVNGINTFWIRARVSAYTSITTQPKGRRSWWTRSDSASGGAYVGMAYFNSGAYLVSAGSFYVWDSTLNYFTEKESLTSITDICVYNGKLYVALGSTSAYQYSSDGDTFTASTAVDDDFTYFMVAPSFDGLTHVLYGADSNYVKVTSNPDNGGTEWSDAHYIGDSTTSITALMLHQNMVLVGKPDGLYHIRSDESVVPMLPELQLAQSSNNFRYHVNYKGRLYFSLDTRIGEITEYGKYNVIDPFQNIDDMVTKGKCVGLSCDRDYLYASMYNGANTVLYKGYKDDNYKWCWSPIYYHSGNAGTINVMQVSSNNTMLWIYHSSLTLYYTTLSDNPLADANYEFNSAGYLITSWYDAGDRDWTKILESIVCECRGWDNDTPTGSDLSANVSVTIYYEIDETGTWTQIDTAYTDDNPKAGSWVKKYLDASTLANGKKIRFKIALASNDASITPVIKYFGAYGQVRPNYVKVFDFAIDVDPSLDAMADTKTLKDFLVGGRTATGLNILGDMHRTNHYIEFLPGYPKEVMAADETGRQYRLVMAIRAIAIDWS